jgi:fucose permease
MILTYKYLKDFKDPVYQKTEFLKTGIRILKDKDLYNAISINGVLRVFYSWMIIYTPIYLTSVIGFTISETALIIGLALIPFLIITNPLGYVADKVLGEKEIMVCGFIVISVSTMLMMVTEVKDFWIWVAILFSTRIGASMIEVMGEAYLFKKISESDLNMVSFFRILNPLTNLIFPTIASGLLLFINIKYLFLILGIFMLYGIKYSLAIKDTR